MAGPRRGSSPVQAVLGSHRERRDEKRERPEVLPGPQPYRALRILPELEKTVPLFFFFWPEQVECAVL